MGESSVIIASKELYDLVQLVEEELDGVENEIVAESDKEGVLRFCCVIALLLVLIYVAHRFLYKGGAKATFAVVSVVMPITLVYFGRLWGLSHKEAVKADFARYRDLVSGDLRCESEVNCDVKVTGRRDQSLLYSILKKYTQVDFALSHIDVDQAIPFGFSMHYNTAGDGTVQSFLLSAFRSISTNALNDSITWNEIAFQRLMLNDCPIVMDYFLSKFQDAGQVCFGKQGHVKTIARIMGLNWLLTKGHDINNCGGAIASHLNLKMTVAQFLSSQAELFKGQAST